MKIGQKIHKPARYRPNERINIDNSDMNNSFSDFMHHQDKQYSQQILEKILNEIDEQSKNLVNSKNLRELKIYKSLIKKFMEEALKAAILLEEQFSYDKVGRTKKYKLIREIDKKLLDLTNLTLEKEVDQINLLEQIGEIRGLLVNLYY